MIIPPLPHNSTTLVLRRTFKATRQRVFRAWISPAALESWFSPGGMAITVRSLDARVGGSFHFEVEDGSYVIGTYLQVMPPEQLAFTWSRGAIGDKETVVTLNFLDQGPLTEVVLTHEWQKNPELLTRLEKGWSCVFDVLASLLSSPDLDF